MNALLQHEDLINATDNNNATALPTPHQLQTALSVSPTAFQSIQQHRQTLQRILNRQDSRMMVVVGPCSIHNIGEALTYADRLRTLADEVQDRLVLVMRAYLEKPRTSLGWEGLVNDPYLDGTNQIADGLQMSRRLMLNISDMGLPIATEVLDPMISNYFNDLVSWAAIGARTAESQIHRKLASSLPAIVGFKNGTDGSIPTAINAMKSAAARHSYVGLDANGQMTVQRSAGNPHTHVVLRGGNDGPNYAETDVNQCVQAMQAADFLPNIMVDCSHANSHKRAEKQIEVLNETARQRRAGNDALVGVMLESNLAWGNQSLPDIPHNLEYGVSVTDACIDWDTTLEALRGLYQQLA
ncbi:MAG: 3-deoxy-7-phosphoheptulonate synthase [Pseudomonadota bacterium]